MADHRLVFADGEDEACQAVRGPRTIHEPHDSYPKAGAVAIIYVDGWTDVRFPADDFDRLWANATAGPRKRGPAPELFESIITKMRAYDPVALDGMKVIEMAAKFDASATTCRLARKAVRSPKK